MSDEDKDIDIESDDDEDSVSGSGGIGGGRTDLQFASQAEKRAHHNALERKRRDHIKDSFCSLRDSVPSLQGEKVRKNEKASRAQILKKAADYIDYMRRKHGSHQQDIDDLKKQNKLLESQIRALEKTKYTGNYAMSSSPGLNQTKNESLRYDGSASESSDSDSSPQQQNKKIKT